MAGSLAQPKTNPYREEREKMKVLDEGSTGFSEGDTIDLADLDLPVKGTAGLLIVFWKEK